MAIARAVVNDPPIVLADEPVGSLDQTTGRQILALLGELADNGDAVIMVTHNPESTAEVDRVIQIRDGRITCDDHLGICAVSEEEAPTTGGPKR